MPESAKYLIEQDLRRYGIAPKFGFGVFVKYALISVVPGIKFSMVFRLCQHYRRKNRILFYFYLAWLRRIKYRYGFDISHRTQIGKGLYIGHFGGIVVHGDAIIGDNCNLSQGITIGVLNRGKNSGIPVIGNRVFIGPGAVILGGIRIGDDAMIGPNAVVSFDVADKSVIAAPRPTVISQQGSEGYVGNIAEP